MSLVWVTRLPRSFHIYDPGKIKENSELRAYATPEAAAALEIDNSACFCEWKPDGSVARHLSLYPSPDSTNPHDTKFIESPDFPLEWWSVEFINYLEAFYRLHYQEDAE